ncbi:MAG: aminotransferase class IV, partial [Pseudomonadota bacterium]
STESVLDGRLCDYEGHRVRLHRSLAELKMASPVTDDELLEIHRELVRRNALTEGTVYLQITRGAADRDFAWPKDATPGIVLFTQDKALEDAAAARTGIRVRTQPDLRWGRRDIKTVQLLYPSFAKMMAREQGADDAWMLADDGTVTEGTSNNAYIVKDGRIVTRHLSTDILHGITRAAVLAVAHDLQMQVEERPFTPAEAAAADEAFITAASTFVCPVVEIDGTAIGTGQPGPVAKRLREVYIREARAKSI